MLRQSFFVIDLDVADVARTRARGDLARLLDGPHQAATDAICGTWYVVQPPAHQVGKEAQTRRATAIIEGLPALISCAPSSGPLHQQTLEFVSPNVSLLSSDGL